MHKDRVLVIPDPQIRDRVPIQHMEWAARYAIEKEPGLLVCLGDLFDLGSISPYDEGTLAAEGKRLIRDLRAAKRAFTLFNTTLGKSSSYKPRKVFLTGNHEDRLDRLILRNPWFHGLLDEAQFADGVPLHPVNMARHFGWEVVPYLKPWRHRGVVYSHYFANPRSGRPIGGTCHNLLNKIGESFVQGHRQELDVAIRDTPAGRRIRGLIAGAFYIHNEPYMGHRGINHWRGVVMLVEVNKGWYNLVEASLGFLRSKFS